MTRSLLPLLVLWAILLMPRLAWPQGMDAEAAASWVEPPYQIGEALKPGVWRLTNLDGRDAGFCH